MFLKDFTVERQLKYMTVYMYIKRSGLLENHTSKINEKIWLDEIALKDLEEKYPLEIEKQSSLEKELIKAQQQIIQLQQILVDVQPKLLAQEYEREKIEELENVVEKKDLEIEKLNEKIAELEKNKEKSLLQKLFGKN